MFDISTLIQSGAANPWLYLPAAILLGGLHALEPGHSKSLMAAFIIAIRGTPAQAVLLGLSAAVGHTIIVWGLALLGLYLGDKLILEKAEPWLVLISGLLIVLLALRLLLLIRRDVDRHEDPNGHGDHGQSTHGHSHPHAHDAHAHDAYAHDAGAHDARDHHSHEAHGHAGDAHAAAHARDIEQRFAGRRQVSAGEIVWFGFTGGLLPCPAAIAVLLVCLQLKAVALGVAMVAAFSVGLAVTMVAVGVAAAWGAGRAARSWYGFDVWSKRMPYISGVLVLALGLFITMRGLGELGVFGPR